MNDRLKNAELLREIRDELGQVLDDDERALRSRARMAEPAKRLAHAFIELDESLMADGELPPPWAHAKNPLVTPGEAATTIERMRSQFTAVLHPAELRALADAERALQRLSQVLGTS